MLYGSVTFALNSRGLEGSERNEESLLCWIYNVNIYECTKVLSEKLGVRGIRCVQESRGHQHGHAMYKDEDSYIKKWNVHLMWMELKKRNTQEDMEWHGES